MHQTLLIIAYLFTRLAFSDTARSDISRNIINRKMLQAFLLDKNDKISASEDCSRVGYIVITFYLVLLYAIFLLAMHQPLLIIVYLITRLAFSDTALWDIPRNTINLKTLRAFILNENYKIFASEDFQRDVYIVITFYLVFL